MSLGSQMRALTANRARPNSSTIAAGSRVERRKFTGVGRGAAAYLVIVTRWRGRPCAQPARERLRQGRTSLRH